MRAKIKILLVTLFVITVNTLWAQSVLQSNTNKSDLLVKGTSSLHDWVMTTDKFNCSITVNNNGNSLLIKDVNFSCNATLKSDNSIMDKKASDALKSKEFKTIQFGSNESISINAATKKVEGVIKGELKLKGKTKIVNLPYQGELDEMGNLKINGALKLKMSEFDIEPPTALMGSLKTGDEVTVTYAVVFDQISLVSVNK